MHQAHLPQEILILIFSYLQLNDLLACLLVCYQWQVPAKHVFYTEIDFHRFSSISSFIAIVQSDPDHPNLLVKKITFSTEEYLEYATFEAFQVQFGQLMELCPYVETIACADRHKKYIVEALHKLQVPLRNLTAFPYTNIYQYFTCTRLYSHNLKEYVLKNFEARLKAAARTGLTELVNFPRLQKLTYMDEPVCTLQEIEHILNTCPDLKDLSVMLYDNPFEEEFDDLQQDVFLLYSHPTQLQTSTQTHYPKLKQLLFRSSENILDLEPFNRFLRKFNRLKQFDFEVIDLLTTERPGQQLEAVIFFLDIIHTIPSVSFTVKGTELSQVYPVVFDYLQLFFQPDVVWKHTSLKIYTTKGFYFRDTLHYFTSKVDEHRKLAIVLPEFDTCNPSIHNAYVRTFAPYINTLEVNYEYSRTGFNPCESFVYTVLSRCIALNSLTIYYGSCLKPLPPTTNATLRSLDIRHCATSPVFLKWLSVTCVNLRYLTVSPNIHRKGISCIMMKHTALEQLDLNLKQLKAKLPVVIIKITTSEIEKAFHVDFKKGWCIALRKDQLEMYQAVELKFKRVRRLKVLLLTTEATFDLE
jgi:hypothetical protein